MEYILNVFESYLFRVLEALPQLLVAILVFIAFWILAKSLAKLSRTVTEKWTDDESLKKLFATVTKVLTFTVGAFVAASIIFPGLQAGDLIGVLGLSSVAIGFAFKDIFQNFLAGILLLLQRPFQIGDAIVVNGYEGVIENITIRATKLKTYDSQLIIIPNATIYSSPVQVRTAFDQRRMTLSTGIGYGENITEGKRVIEQALASCETIDDDPEPQVLVTTHGDSSVGFDVKFWTTASRSSLLAAQDEVATKVKDALDDADIEIPYPYRTVELHNMDE